MPPSKKQLLRERISVTPCMMQNKLSILSYTVDQLRELFVENKLPKYAADQVYDWLYRKWNLDIDSWSNVGKKVKGFLVENNNFSLPKIIWDGVSTDGTRKFLLQLDDEHTIESVVIPAKGRLSICISTQVGCAIGCKFCHTGTQGFIRNLTIGEIVGQLVSISKWLIENVDPEIRISNMVYMGQGEPLHNFDNVKTATEIFMEDKGIAIGQRKITLSTSGLVPQIEKLADFPSINIAISLHSAIDEIRDELMPINKKYDLTRLFEAIRSIPLKAYRRITYEYLLIDGMNNRKEDIEALCKLINIKESKINLIPFNEYPDSKFKRPSEENVLWFMDQLIKKGYTCTIRQSKGSDILAACGQLKSEYQKINLWD